MSKGKGKKVLEKLNQDVKDMIAVEDHDSDHVTFTVRVPRATPVLVAVVTPDAGQTCLAFDSDRLMLGATRQESWRWSGWPKAKEIEEGLDKLLKDEDTAEDFDDAVGISWQSRVGDLLRDAVERRDEG